MFLFNLCIVIFQEPMLWETLLKSLLFLPVFRLKNTKKQGASLHSAVKQQLMG